MNINDFFTELEKICPYEDFENEVFGYDINSSGSSCFLTKNLICGSSLCPMVDIMVSVTQWVNMHKDAGSKQFKGIKSDEFFDIIHTVCEYQEPVETSDTTTNTFTCKLNNDRFCEKRTCPAMICFTKYIRSINKKLNKVAKVKSDFDKEQERLKTVAMSELISSNSDCNDTTTDTTSTKVGIHVMRNKATVSADSEGWTAIDSNEEFNTLVAHEDVSLKQITHRTAGGLNRLVWQYRFNK